MVYMHTSHILNYLFCTLASKALLLVRAAQNNNPYSAKCALGLDLHHF